MVSSTPTGARPGSSSMDEGDGAGGELANAGEGAIFAELWHGEDKRDVINLECSLRHLADHVAELCGLPADTLVDLCTERGRLIELPSRFSDTPATAVLAERAEDVLRKGYVYIPVLIATEPPAGAAGAGGGGGGALALGAEGSRPSSSRSQAASRHGTARGRARDARDVTAAPVGGTQAVGGAGGGGGSSSGDAGLDSDGDGSHVAAAAAALAAEAAATSTGNTVNTVAVGSDDVRIYYHVLLNPDVLTQSLPAFELQVRGAKVSAKASKSSSSLRRTTGRK